MSERPFRNLCSEADLRDAMTDDGRVIICSPPSVTERRYCRCPTCKARRRFVVSVFVWYDAIWTCCSCGDSWSAGERMMRPALRGWRGAAAEKARDRWAAAPPRAEARRLEEVMVREAQGEPDDQWPRVGSSWETEAEAVEEGLLGCYLLSGFEVREVP